jgi:branched-chain amino acid transport system permease protein
MTRFLQFLVDGVSIGAVYALIALGYVIIFKASEVVTFAHGGVLAIGGYMIWWSRARWFDGKGQANFWLSVAVGLLVALAVSLFVERLFIRRMQAKAASIIGICILTLGVDVILETYTNYGVGKSGKELLDLRNPWGIGAQKIAGMRIGDARIAALIICTVIIAGLFLWLKYSDWGVAMRAAATNREAASLMGIRLGWVSLLAWAIAAALATLAAIFLSAAPTPGFDGTTGRLALKAFPAAILGGLDSPGGALVGGITIGIAESLSKGYQQDITFLGSGFSAVVPYVVMLLVLVVRPTGLFGSKVITRA